MRRGIVLVVFAMGCSVAPVDEPSASASCSELAARQVWCGSQIALADTEFVEVSMSTCDVRYTLSVQNNAQTLYEVHVSGVLLEPPAFIQRREDLRLETFRFTADEVELMMPNAGSELESFPLWSTNYVNPLSFEALPEPGSVVHGARAINTVGRYEWVQIVWSDLVSCQDLFCDWPELPLSDLPASPC